MRAAILILIVLAGLGLRLGEAWNGTTDNLDDSAAYERIAIGLHDDGVFEQRGPGVPAHPQPASNYSPGLPLLVAGIYDVTGGVNTRTARLVLALLASLAIPLAFMLGSRLGGTDAGLVGAAITAFYPTLVADNSMMLTESLAATLAIGSVLAILRARDRRHVVSWILPGLLLGALTMVRPEYLMISIFVAGVLVLMEIRGGLWSAVRAPLVMLAAGLVVIAPWSIHNLIRIDRPVLSTGGGQTLFTGSYMPAHGDPQKVMFIVLDHNPDIARTLLRQNRISGEGADSITPERVFKLLAARERPGVTTDAALGQMGRAQYRRAWSDSPPAVLNLFRLKIQRIWWRGRGNLTDPIPGRIFHWSIVVAALIGMAFAWTRRRNEFWVLLPFFIGATLIGVYLVASPRRALVLWPLVSALAGLGVCGTIGFIRARLGDGRTPVALP